MDHINKFDVLAVRLVFIALLGAVAGASQPFSLSIPLAICAGVATGLVVVALEMRLRRVSLQQLIAGAAGMLVGSIIGILLVILLALTAVRGGPGEFFVDLAVPLGCAYLGILIGFSKADMLNLNALSIFSGELGSKQAVKLLDTSVIID